MFKQILTIQQYKNHEFITGILNLLELALGFHAVHVQRLFFFSGQTVVGHLWSLIHSPQLHPLKQWDLKISQAGEC